MNKRKVAQFEAYIDPTQFSALTNHLYHPDGRISYLVHVKDRDLLPRLAADLDDAMATGWPHAMDRVLTMLMRKGAVKVTGRDKLSLRIAGAEVPAQSVPRTATSHVIYLPPFYLAHTPGLFEGKFDQSKAQSRTAAQQQEGSQQSKRNTSRLAQLKRELMSH